VKRLPDGLHFHHELLLGLFLKLFNFLDGNVGCVVILQLDFLHYTRGTVPRISRKPMVFFSSSFKVKIFGAIRNYLMTGVSSWS
jgi:hypothetical protein